MTNGRWLGTGGAGYIGAHVVHALTATGREAVVVDDLSTGSASRLPTTVEVLEMTVLDTAALRTSFSGCVRRVSSISRPRSRPPSR